MFFARALARTGASAARPTQRRLSLANRGRTLVTQAKNAKEKDPHNGKYGGWVPPHVDPKHTVVGEVAMTVTFFWIFYRFYWDGAVLLGLKHPWDGHIHGSFPLYDHDVAAETEKHPNRAYDTYVAYDERKPSPVLITK